MDFQEVAPIGAPVKRACRECRLGKADEGAMAEPRRLRRTQPRRCYRCASQATPYRGDFQGTLFADDAATAVGFERTELGRGAWVDVARSWLPAADAVFETLLHTVPWRAERREMYDRVVAVPRLLHTYMEGEPLPHPALTTAREALNEHYAAELGEPFVTAGCCYYRDGRDSVAWHGDRIGRGRSQDTMVAIVSVGDPRKLALRPRGGGEGLSVSMGHGDLLVMGGSCQRTWEHAVPKVAGAGPRISVQFRPRNVF